MTIPVCRAILQEGLANLVLVGGSCTTQRAKIEQNMPKKHGAAVAGYDKAMEKFYNNCLQVPIRLYQKVLAPFCIPATVATNYPEV
jgi:stalled ribosome rescue protein Dom34